MSTAAAPNEPTTTTTEQTGPWMRWVDDWSERIGDRLNPILVKETRQALKSRQFVITFGVLLVAALGWTVIGSLMLMPQIYTQPSAQRMLTGYYITLAIPMLLVVPLAAYRSLEGEIDDGTLELLSITSLGPWQIVLGKLASASLQMVLYLVTLFPCVAYAYTLRGVDLPTTFLIVAMLIVGALLLTVVALFFAPLARSRTGRIATLLMVMLILLFAQYFVGAGVIGLIWYGNPMETQWMVYSIIAVSFLALSLGHLLLTATAAQLTPESENRSTPLRLSLLALTAIVVGLSFYAMQFEGDRRDPFGAIVFMMSNFSLAVLWTVCGSMMVAESPVMTPRIRRELPSSFFARMMLTWVTPGPATGLVFVVAVVIGLLTWAIWGLEYLIGTQGAMMGPAGPIRGLYYPFAILWASYLIAFLVCVRGIVALLRINNNPRAEIGVAALIAVAVIFALVPYSMQLHWNDYRQFDYSRWQITNWAWTMGEVSGSRFNSGDEYWVAAVAATMFAICLMTTRVVLPRKIATPKRVEEERAKLGK